MFWACILDYFRIYKLLKGFTLYLYYYGRRNYRKRSCWSLGRSRNRNSNSWWRGCWVMFGRSYEVNYDPEQYRKYIVGINHALLACKPVIRPNDFAYDLMNWVPIRLHHKTVWYNMYVEASDILNLIESYQRESRHIHFNWDENRSVKEIPHFHLLKPKNRQKKEV